MKVSLFTVALFICTQSQCCGAGPFLCGSGSSLEKFRLRLEIRPFSPSIFENFKIFACFKQFSNFLDKITYKMVL
jgi:hypothetical protein